MFHDVDNFKTYVGILTNVNTNISLDILTSFVRKVIEKNGYNSDQCISGGKKKKKNCMQTWYNQHQVDVCVSWKQKCISCFW